MKKIILSIFIVNMALPGLIAKAQVTDWKYFEYSPSTSSAINVSSFGAVYQAFKPYNDFIDGVDVWADNTGSQGYATFKIVDQNNAAIASKQISVTNLPVTWGGNRIHVAFSPLKVYSTSTYMLKVSTTMPKLRMYYQDDISILEHNAPVQTSQMLESAYLDNSQQSFNFKIAIYESGDTLPPEVSNISFKRVSNTQMRIDLNANEPIDVRMDYSTTYNSKQINDIESLPFTGDYNICAENSSICSLFFNVVPDSTYNYNLYVRDYWGNQTEISGSFQNSDNPAFSVNTGTSTATQPANTSSSTMISNIRLAYISAFSAKLAWTTDIPAASRVLISTDQAGTQVAARLGDNTFELEHLIDTGSVLTPNTHYFATIISDNFSSDIAGEMVEFTTLPQNQNNNQNNNQTNSPPQQLNQETPISNEQARQIVQNNGNFQNSSDSLPVLSVSSNTDSNAQLTIGWDNPLSGEPQNGYRIDIFDHNNNLVRQINVNSGTHEVSINGLDYGNYRAVVYANNNDTYEKIAKSTGFEIAKKPSFWEKIGFNSLVIVFAVFAVLVFIIAVILKIKKKKLQ